LPHVLAQLIVEKDYDAIRLTTNYKLFVLGHKRFEARQRNRVSASGVRVDQTIDIAVGELKSTFVDSAIISRVWSYDLDEQTSYLCSTAEVFDKLLPLILTRAGRSELVFFAKQVLRGRLSLRETILARDRPILQSLVWEVGRTRGVQGPAVRAIKVAALARSVDLDNASEAAGSILTLDNSMEKTDLSAVADWVNPNFMFLLVNVVQLKWRAGSFDERVQALRSLSFIMGLLNRAESPRYFPQIMATFNAAISLPKDSEGSKVGHVHFLAVQVLSQFVRLVAENHWETLGQNLNVVVVSLIPVVAENIASKEHDFQSETRHEAISLLEWLAEGDLGKNLRRHFSEIPFLPSSPALENMRASLRSLGIDFDNVITTQGTQEGFSRASHTSEAGSASVDHLSSDSSNALRQGALRHRLEIVCSLLDNENTGIRQVALKHAADLLRANRELFHALVENEGDASMKHYVTVARPGTSGKSMMDLGSASLKPT
jgi:hypothetical protein